MSAIEIERSKARSHALIRRELAKGRSVADIKSKYRAFLDSDLAGKSLREALELLDYFFEDFETGGDVEKLIAGFSQSL